MTEIADRWEPVDWKTIVENWWDCTVGLICPCGEEVILVDEDQECSCGRVYRLNCRLEVKQEAGL